MAGSTTVRRFGHAVLAALLLLALPGCGGASGARGAASESTAGDVTRVEHRFGTTKVRGMPERIVSLDMQWTDSLLALGVVPVGYQKDSMMPGGMPPWWDSDAMTGEPLAVDDGLPLEKIAALKPDLIVGSLWISDKKTYETLYRIAPTVTGTTTGRVEKWENLVAVLGDVLDKPGKAKSVISSVDAQVTAAANELPGLENRTFALAQYVVRDGRIGVVADERDAASALFVKLGMRLDDTLAKAGRKSNNARVFVSIERLDLLRSDFLAIWVNGGAKSDLSGIPGWDRLRSVESGAAAVVDYPVVVAVNTPTPLSTPYALKALRPYLNAAA